MQSDCASAQGGGPGSDAGPRLFPNAASAITSSCRHLLVPQLQTQKFFETPRRLGVLGHVADDEQHRLFRNQVEEVENLREDACNLMLFEWARELLMEDG